MLRARDLLPFGSDRAGRCLVYLPLIVLITVDGARSAAVVSVVAVLSLHFSSSGQVRLSYSPLDSGDDGLPYHCARRDPLDSRVRASLQQWKDVRNNPTMHFIVGRTGTILSEPFGAEQLGYTGELVGRSVLTVFDDADRARAACRRCLDPA